MEQALGVLGFLVNTVTYQIPNVIIDRMRKHSAIYGTEFFRSLLGSVQMAAISVPQGITDLLSRKVERHDPWTLTDYFGARNRGTSGRPFQNEPAPLWQGLNSGDNRPHAGQGYV